VKPANILVTEHAGATAPLLAVKVADFGIAKMDLGDDATELTEPGAVVGTAAYLSPEQVQGATPDACSDQYALGVVLYEMLCGAPPFNAQTELATALLHVRATPERPSAQQPAVSSGLESVVLKAMAKDPADRYPSLAAMRDALSILEVEGAAEVAASLDQTSVLDMEDDAVPQVVRHATPPAGTRPIARPAARPRGLVAGLAALAGIAAIAVAVLLAGGGNDDRNPGGASSDGGGSGGGSAVAVSSTRSFDPQATPAEENEEAVGLAVDGNPATAWNTDTYNTRPFGGLKAGVGLIVLLAEAADLSQLLVTSPTNDWAAAVYLAPSPATDLAGWGEPVATADGIAGNAQFDLGGRRAAAVLIWITDTGPTRRAEVSEVSLRG